MIDIITVNMNNSNINIINNSSWSNQKSKGIYNYVYDNKTKEIKFFKNKKYVFSNTVIYADENMIILKHC